MLGIFTNNADYPIPFDYFAFIANGLHAGFNFHSLYSPNSETFTSSNSFTGSVPANVRVLPNLHDDAFLTDSQSGSWYRDQRLPK